MKTEEIKRLVDRFFDGETTVKEERKLYAYFQNAEIPESLQEYREMFLDMAAVDTEFMAMQTRKPKFKFLPVWSRIAIGTAAMIAIVFGATLFVNHIEENKLANLYGGSYVIVNGQRIDDLRKIKNTINETLSDAEKLENKVANLQTIDDVENEVLQNVKDLQQRKLMEQMLKD